MSISLPKEGPMQEPNTARDACIAPPDRATLRSALGAIRPGHALPQIFYKDPAIFRDDMRHFVMAHWHVVGHASMVAAAGDYFTTEVAGESLIVVRGQDERIRALLNVCRHRGSRVCTEAHGTARGGTFVCPYHAWTYDTQGQLQSARVSANGFDKTRYGLKQVPARVCEGVIFITFADPPLDFEQVEQSFGRTAHTYAWADARVAARRMYLIDANWKLVIENYHECYHCGPAHREYSRRHVFSRPQPLREGPDRALYERDAALGVALCEVDFYAQDAAPGQESADCGRSSLFDGFKTGSRDGQPLAPLMGQFRGKDFDGGFSFLDVGPTSNFVAYPDHGVIYRTAPLTVDKTAFELFWLVDRNAVEGKDYREEDLVWMWDWTSIEDKKIVELNQAGVNSAFFEPGPYTPMEEDTQRYVDWYVQSMKRL
jgi:Rieske 2Fe-2S family protein